MEDHATTAHLHQLFQGIVVIARLADLFAIEGGHLIGADDQCAGLMAGYRQAFLLCQSQCGLLGCFVFGRGFVEVWRYRFKR